MVKCKNCGQEFNPTEKHKDSLYCCVCRKYRKNCEICEKEIFVQARTCSKKCAYELRKKSWLRTCGSDHNFSKNSTSRKKWETKLFEEEGIVNVFQREKVKEKCRQKHIENLGVENPSQSSLIKEKKICTCLEHFGVKHPLQSEEIKERVKQTFIKKYGKIRITNPEKISETRNGENFHKQMEEKGLWIPLKDLSEYQIYYRNVYQITQEYVKIYFDKEVFEENRNKKHKDKISIDHRYSIFQGFKDKVSPEIIGCIVNLEIMPFTENSRKNQKCTISLNRLLNDYKNYNENKVNQKN